MAVAWKPFSSSSFFFLFFFCCCCFSFLAISSSSFLLASSARDLPAAADLQSFVSILGDSPHVHHFAIYAKRFGKHYSTEAEVRHRFHAFVQSLNLIEASERRKLPYKLALNSFADLTWDEFQRGYLGAGQQNCSATKRTENGGRHNYLRAKGMERPKTKDWRLDGVVTPVKNQGHCGSCWTFSTTGALEAAHAQATGEIVLLSEQQLIDCAGGFNNFGCNGGLPSQAFEYIISNGGLDTEDAYPYQGQDGACQFNEVSVGARVYDVVNITLGAEDELQDAVGFVRPVSVAFEVIRGFHLYAGGVFTSADCSDSPETVNHAVLAVGYDTDESGTPYWIIKNSWGDSWGLDGFFYMELGKNMCGIATCASYPVVTEEEAKIQMA